MVARWFVGLSPDDPVWDPTVFTKNRDRLQHGEVFAKFMSKLLNHPQVRPLLSDRAWAPPIPSSRTSTMHRSPSAATFTQAVLARACLTTLVSASAQKK